MENTEIATHARKVVDVIIERGWCQGRNEDQSGQVCAVKAMALALDSTVVEVLESSLYRLFLAYLDSIHEQGLLGVTFWNDRDDRTMNDVINAFRAFALLIEVTGDG